MSTSKLAETFIVLDGAFHAHAVPVTPTLYEELDRNFAQFKSCVLISEYTFDKDWPSWEQHPAGDEILYLVSGAAEIHMLTDGVISKVKMDQPGTTLIVKKAVWHTAKIVKPCKILFMTPGEGTQHRPDQAV